jgi:hypothetical protein
VKMIVFWDIAPCSLVQVDRRFRGAYCLHPQGDETSVYFNKTTRRCIPEGYHLHIRRLENPKSHKLRVLSSMILFPYASTLSSGTSDSENSYPEFVPM